LANEFLHARYFFFGFFTFDYEGVLEARVVENNRDYLEIGWCINLRH